MTGCVTGKPKFYEKLLPGGKIWEISYGTDYPGKKRGFLGCTGHVGDENECMSSIRPKIEAKSVKLCGNSRPTLLECKKISDSHMVTCLVQCGSDKNSIPASYSNSNDEDGDELELTNSKKSTKSEKCADKGGVWKNGTCELTID
jgi:hypothetical protein